jgi:hypothetical protein
MGISTSVLILFLALPSRIEHTLSTEETFPRVPHSPMYKWTMAAPPGSGTHQHDWKAGTYPSAVTPVMAFNNHLWMVGQKRSWTSSDGIHWTAFDKHDWGERISTSAVYFNNTLWVSGGMEYATNTFLSQVWASGDGKKWELKVKEADWSPRKGHTTIEFQGRLWLFGGETSVDEQRAPDKFINDIWSSSDGIRWTKVMDEAPWRVRGNPKLIVFKEKLWLVGGQGQSDIWNSADGKAWTKVADETPWKGRFDYGVAALDSLIWVYGGRESNPRMAHNDVWLSPDGKNWILQINEAPWTRRSGNFSTTFDNKLLLYGGKHTGHDDSFAGDIWTMERVDH